VSTTPRKQRPAEKKGLIVVDDDKLVRWSIRESLRSEYRVWTAESAEQALRMLHRIKHVHGMLVDVRLPGACGYELIQKVKALRPELKVFVMTGYDPQSAPRQAFSVQADGYLSKPFSMEMLHAMMASHLMTWPTPRSVISPAIG